MNPLEDHFRRLDNADTRSVFYRINNTEIGKQQIDDIFGNYWVGADIDGTTLYMGGYQHLAKCIPLRMPVYDFGAAYGFQSWHFRFHKRYIGITPFSIYTRDAHFRTDNSVWCFLTAQEFFEQFGVEEDAFAIVNAVPDPEVAELVKKHFKYCYIFYV